MTKDVIQMHVQGEQKGWTKDLDTGKRNCELPCHELHFSPSTN